MKLIVISLVISSLLLPAKHLDKTKNNSQRFLDKVQTIDPDAKFELDQLKEFQAQKDQIDVRYEQKRNTLKNKETRNR